MKNKSYINKHNDFQNYKLSEKDFYPPHDTRVFKSGVKDIIDGDSFDDYLDCFWEMCYEEEIFED